MIPCFLIGFLNLTLLHPKYATFASRLKMKVARYQRECLLAE
jgi:hypothetical protein